MKRRGRDTLAIAAALIWIVSQRQPAVADVVVLTNGKTLEGRVTRDGDMIVIEQAQGVIKLPRDKVRSILPKRTVLDEYAERREKIEKEFAAGALPPKDAAERWFELSQWAAGQNFTRAREESLKHALEKDGDHAGARKAKGFVEHNGKWMSVNDRNAALGFVLFEGRWVPPEAVEDVKKMRKR
jgi:hypothetical protein